MAVVFGECGRECLSGPGNTAPLLHAVSKAVGGGDCVLATSERSALLHQNSESSNAEYHGIADGQDKPVLGNPTTKG